MSSDDTFLDGAAAIGRRVVADAVWHEGRCSWMGAVVNEDQPWSPEYRALEPDLYGGTAGVGLLLAQLAIATGDPACRRTAIGALRHATSRAAGLPPARHDGFHAGSPGIAWAAASAAAVLDEDELRAGASSVLSGAAGASSERHRCPDVMMGAAGSIVALLALADLLEESRLVELALAAGGDLIGSAKVTRHGWSWAIPGARYAHDLCGLAHGAAGIAWALLELYSVTGEERWRAAAMGAFEYERSWMDSGSWPDLRIAGQRREAAPRTPSVAAGTWCHGEAGIALTRLRAIALLGPGAHAEEAEVALEATRRRLEGALPYAIDDFSLCHGAGGAAEALLCGATALGGRWRAGAQLADELGSVALSRHPDASDPPPGGTGTGVTPGLFRGLSGIAWFFLRLHDATIPSPIALPTGVDSAVREDVGSVNR